MSSVNTHAVVRDAVAGALLVLGLVLPWNIYFGVGTGTVTIWVYAVLIIVTVLSIAGLVLGRSAPESTRLPLFLNIPYLVVVVGFLGFTIVQAFRHGGTGAVPPGIGPGALAGLAGSVLAARPSAATTVGDRAINTALRSIGIASLVLASVTVLANLYWRTRFLIPEIGDPVTGSQHAVTVFGALLYAVVAIAPVVIAARWIMSSGGPSRLATVLLGASSLIAAVLVWLLPVGRELDSFHGIAQNTSTAGVGFEGYLSWVAAAALVATPTAFATYGRQDDWRGAIRKCLVLVAAWCVGTAVLRISDLMTNAALDLPAIPYNSTALMAFDIITAVLAIWLFLNGFGRSASFRLSTLLLGALLVLTVSRVILGVTLVPRTKPLDPTAAPRIYGNTLSQQITSTFDVALCVLALGLVAVSLVAARAPRGVPRPVPVAAPVVLPHVAPAPAVSTPPLAGTTRPAIRVGEPAPPNPGDRVADVLAESTRRFAAGTTYGSPQQAPPNHGPQ